MKARKHAMQAVTISTTLDVSGEPVFMLPAFALKHVAASRQGPGCSCTQLPASLVSGQYLAIIRVGVTSKQTGRYTDCNGFSLGQLHPVRGLGTACRGTPDHISNWLTAQLLTHICSPQDLQADLHCHLSQPLSRVAVSTSHTPKPAARPGSSCRQVGPS